MSDDFEDDPEEWILRQVNVRLSVKTLDRIKSYQVRAKQRCPWLALTRADAIRVLIAAALDADEQAPKTL